MFTPNRVSDYIMSLYLRHRGGLTREGLSKPGIKRQRWVSQRKMEVNLFSKRQHYTSIQEHTTGIKETAGQTVDNDKLIKIRPSLLKFQSLSHVLFTRKRYFGYVATIYSHPVSTLYNVLVVPVSSSYFWIFVQLVSYSVSPSKKNIKGFTLSFNQIVIEKYHVVFRENKICCSRWTVH